MLRELHKLGHNLTFISLISNKHEQSAEMISELGTLYAEDGKFKPYSLFSAIKSTLTRQPVTVQHRMKEDIMHHLLQKVSEKPDVILIEGLHAAYFIDQLRAKFPNTSVVLRQVNVEHLVFERNAAQVNNPLRKWFLKDQSHLMKKFEIQKMKKADYVTAISQNDINSYRKYLPEKDFFLNTAGAHLKPEPSEARDPSMILAVSNWKWQPNIDGLNWFLKNVWPDIEQEHPQLELHIAGEGLTDTFKQKYTFDNIHYLGFVDDIDTLRLKASIFIAPLLSGSGMKLKILEALAAGLPTVTTTFGVEGILMEDGVHYLHAETAGEFKHKVDMLIENKPLRQSLSKNGRELIQKKYTWEQKASELSGFLNSVAG
jgi:glycosyltransferase involved in cell wall biosynthesis